LADAGWNLGQGLFDTRWALEKFATNDVPAVINRLTLRGGEFEFEFHDDQIKISKIRSPSKTV
jgi:hypothetical protein